MGCDGIPVDGADGTELGTGLQNSIDIEGACVGPHGASICVNLFLNGFSDWYLPSKDELDLIWMTLADSDGDGVNNGLSDPNNIGAFQPGIYWSSSEGDETRALFQSLANGFQGSDGKEAFHKIRAIRSF